MLGYGVGVAGTRQKLIIEQAGREGGGEGAGEWERALPFAKLKPGKATATAMAMAAKWQINFASL